MFGAKRLPFVLPILLLLFLDATGKAARDPSDWLAAEAYGAAGGERIRPVFIHPSSLSQKPPPAAEPEGIPFRHPSGPERERILQTPFTPSLIPLHSAQMDRSAGFQELSLHLPHPQAPSKLKTFRALTQTRFFPPDCTIAAGPDKIVVAVNTNIAFYTKTGAKRFQAGFGQWFSSLPEAKGSTLFDPKVLYDQYTAHFIFVVAAIRESPQGSWILLSVSKTSNPEGMWAQYALDMTLDGNTKTKNFADFPGLGIDKDAIYLTANMFRFSSEEFAYAKLRILTKSEVYAFGTVTFFDFVKMKDVTGVLTGTLQPAHSFGTTSQEFLLSCSDARGTKITLWRLTNSTASRPSLSKKGVPVSSFQTPPAAEQKAGVVPLDTSDAGFRANAVFRDGFIYSVHTIAQNWGSGEVAALRLYQLTTDAKIVQEITYGADQLFYFYPAILPDSRGNLVLVFNRSGKTEFVGIHFTGRTKNQPLGQLQNSAVLKTSNTHYVATDDSGRNRFGDYSGIALDSQNDSVWIYGEFAEEPTRWATQVGRVKY